jgi:hypothetical protein
MQTHTYMIGDRVSYCGDKFRSDLGGKMGEIIAPIHNELGGYVVSFGSDDYVMPHTSLTRFTGQIREESDQPKVNKKGKPTKVEPRYHHSQKDEESETE